MQNNFDTTFVRGIDVHPKIGCTPEERAFPQKLIIDLDAYTEQLPPDTPLNQRICYATLTELTREVAELSEWVLVEDLADSIFESAFEKFPMMTGLRIRIEKFAVPGVRCTGIDISRLR